LDLDSGKSNSENEFERTVEERIEGVPRVLGILRVLKVNRKLTLSILGNLSTSSTKNII
jgi:hypothetical protein